tara:strand:- start:969 stop:1160 length:192 start_codon:yes stop_codon:yes gene_type:complete
LDDVSPEMYGCYRLQEALNNKGRQINFRKGVIVTAKNRGVEKRFSRYQYNRRSFFTKGEIFVL